MTNKVNIEELIAQNMKVPRSERPVDCSILLMPVTRRTTTDLQEVWPVLESSLEEYGISCQLDMDRFFIIFTTTRAKDPYAILNSRYLIRLLAAEVPSRQEQMSNLLLLFLMALKVMYGMPCYLIYTGYHSDGLCSKFGIKTEKYVSRKKLLMTLPVQELEKLTGCVIYLCPIYDMVAAMGPVKGLKLVRRIVDDCIVHNMPPAPRVTRLANYVQTIKGVEALRL